jgi:hypothetical protein
LSWLHSFFLSRVLHNGEFYLERFLMMQHCTKQLIYYIFLYFFVIFFAVIKHVGLRAGTTRF